MAVAPLSKWGFGIEIEAVVEPWKIRPEWRGKPQEYYERLALALRNRRLKSKADRLDASYQPQHSEHYDKWFITKDGSLRAVGDQVALEAVSPILKTGNKDWEDELKLFWEAMRSTSRYLCRLCTCIYIYIYIRTDSKHVQKSSKSKPISPAAHTSTSPPSTDPTPSPNSKPSPSPSSLTSTSSTPSSLPNAAGTNTAGRTPKSPLTCSPYSPPAAARAPSRSERRRLGSRAGRPVPRSGIACKVPRRRGGMSFGIS